MTPDPHIRRHNMRLLPAAAIIMAAATIASCGGDNIKDVTGNVDPENFATMTTRDVESMISDSGVTRYRILSPLWLVFDEAREPKWKFPEGLHIERFDETFHPEATIDCDSATYFKSRQLWRLDGHVKVLNTLGERFLTQQLFWDQRNEKVYSDSFIHIERADRVMEGYGFTSNQKMTQFSVRNVSAILPAEQFKPGENQPSDSVDASSTVLQATAPADTTDAPRRQPRQPRTKK